MNMSKSFVYGTDKCKQIWQILVVNTANEHSTAYFKGLCPKVLLRYSIRNKNEVPRSYKKSSSRYCCLRRIQKNADQKLLWSPAKIAAGRSGYEKPSIY